MKRRRNRKRAFAVIGGLLATGSLALLTGCDLQENADLERGEQLFTQQCGSCHALTGAGTNADVGPNLDLAFQEARESGMDQDTIEGVVTDQIQNPRPASPEDTAVYMPPDLVQGDDLRDVAAYVASVAGVPGIQPPEFIAPEFFATNCGGCHTLSQAGTTGTTGPNLDDVLGNMSAEQISEQIVNPNSEIAQGFQAGVMPQNYGETLDPKELRQLVQYLMQAIGGEAGAGAPGSSQPAG
jgi:mono/diheme cytochrome c family protein